MVRITYFVHGTTTDNEHGLATGWAPGELSATGKQQALALGSQVGDAHFDVVFCSDLQRAIESASLAFGDKFEIVEDSRLREANYGNFTGEPAKTFKHRLADYVDLPFPEGESYRDIEHRIASFLNFIDENYSGQSIAIVAHQAPQLALDVLIQGKSWVQAINEDWRHSKAWQPGWLYVYEGKA